MADPFNPYATLYENPRGAGDQRPTALQIVQDNERIGTLTDKVVLITGGTGGMGIEIARALYATGAQIYITARDLEKAKSVCENIEGKGIGKKVEVIEVDLESLDSVKAAAVEFQKRCQKLNILINNAAIMCPPESASKDGFELQFAINHLAHFTLTTLLLPNMIASSTEDFNSRVIFVSSSCHRYSTVHFDNINLKGEYQTHIAYGQSKTAMIWTANNIDRFYSSKGVHALSINPGGVWTDLQKFAPPAAVEQAKKNEQIMNDMQSPEQGAATAVWAAIGNVWEGKGGKYLASCKVGGLAENLVHPHSDGYAPWAYDEEGERKLWDLSLELTGVTARDV
ncbi:putative short-chain dehydrogenase [Dendryphion nanum]|uniref:Short-chain dehydrogenase n=1 Tax=Dendryphion nanum TaxID=256645 RepID=A0A9P9EL86_9PLEO|nr:putative short-chain dehydrogenase [Dendryphion nanum]